MKTIHFISGLKSGGTERNLYKLLRKSKNKNIIFSFSKENFYFKNKNIKIYFPYKDSLIANLSHLFKIPKILKKEKPDIIYCWMIHANIFAGLISYFSGFRNIIWNIRSSGKEYSFQNRNFILFIFLIFLSYLVPKKIVFNSNFSLLSHNRKFLYKKNNFVIFNGFEEKKFFLKPRKKIINYLCVARNHPIKNHQLLFEAFYLLDKTFGEWKLTLVGRNIDLLKIKTQKNKKYKKILEKINFFDEKDNLKSFYQNSNFVVLSSHAESFPNVIGEAMSYGRPVISTNIGDVKNLIINKKLLVNNHSASNFCKALLYSTKLYFSSKKYSFYCKRNRDLINKKFSENIMFDKFDKLEKSLF